MPDSEHSQNRALWVLLVTSLLVNFINRGSAGSWTRIQNCIGNMGGVVSPLVAGRTVGQTGSYGTAFYVADGVILIGVGGYLFRVGPMGEIDWQTNRGEPNDAK